MSRQLKEYPSWVRRMDTYFRFIDKTNKNFITTDIIQEWATNMEVMCKARPNEMVKLRAELFKFWGEIGLTPGVFMKKDDFISGVNELWKEEARRIREGKRTLLEKVTNAYFDVFDVDKSGVLTEKNIRVAMRATNNKPEDAQKWLSNICPRTLGNNKEDMVVDKEDVFYYQFNFWFNPSPLFLPNAFKR